MFWKAFWIVSGLGLLLLFGSLAYEAVEQPGTSPDTFLVGVGLLALAGLMIVIFLLKGGTLFEESEEDRQARYRRDKEAVVAHLQRRLGERGSGTGGSR